MVKSSDFEYFDGNEYLEVVAGEGKATPAGQVLWQDKVKLLRQDKILWQDKVKVVVCFTSLSGSK